MPGLADQLTTGLTPPDCLRLGRRLLLLSDCSFARTLASASVGMGALTANRQVATMAESPIRTDLDEALDVHRNILTQIAFNAAFSFDHLADAIYFIFAEILHLFHGVHFRRIQYARSARVADSIDVRERDIGALVARKVDACNTCHVAPLSLILDVAYVLSLRRSRAPPRCGEDRK